MRSPVFFLVVTLALTIAAAATTSGAAEARDPHAMHHHRIPPPPDARRLTVEYEIPAVNLVRNDGKTVALAEEFNDGRPVFLNFIYTTCTAICPITSQTFAMFQERLGKDRDRVHLMSISIDPEEDTPARLTEYARTFGAGPEWQHYTSSAATSLAVQRAFDVYRGDKMNHVPVTFLRTAPGKPWIRLEGFVTADRLVDEYRRL
jgi:protein SCO1/2